LFLCEGTGHGVGALLNVHELPIIANRKSLEFGGVQNNMIITNEPGYYENGKFGIRIENCYRTRQAHTRHTFADTLMLRFEPLTFVPIQLELVDAGRLDKSELDWLNDYHQRCLSLVGPLLLEANKEQVHAWLVKQTRPL
jgi:Xaa-Pro aminopeptidase